MFKFLFGGKKVPEVKPETNRERFTRLVFELNEMIDTLPTKPKVTFDPATGHIEPELPEQFADEALALPAPPEADATKPEAEEASPTPSSAATDEDTSTGDAQEPSETSEPNPPKETEKASG